MLLKIKELIRRKDSCVLSTVSENRPHCSLMAYIPSEDCDHFYLLTSRSTKKYHNALRNPNVSLLIDTRDEEQSDNRSQTQALTIEGWCFLEEDKTTRQNLKNQFRERFPHLQRLAEHPDSDIFAVRAISYQLLDGSLESYFIKKN